MIDRPLRKPVSTRLRAGSSSMISLLYPREEVDAQLEAYREEAGVLVPEVVQGSSHQGAADAIVPRSAGICACSSLPISSKHQL